MCVLMGSAHHSIAFLVSPLTYCDDCPRGNRNRRYLLLVACEYPWCCCSVVKWWLYDSRMCFYDGINNHHRIRWRNIFSFSSLSFFAFWFVLRFKGYSTPITLTRCDCSIDRESNIHIRSHKGIKKVISFLVSPPRSLVAIIKLLLATKSACIIAVAYFKRRLWSSEELSSISHIMLWRRTFISREAFSRFRSERRRCWFPSIPEQTDLLCLIELPCSLRDSFCIISSVFEMEISLLSVVRWNWHKLSMPFFCSKHVRIQLSRVIRQMKTITRVKERVRTTINTCLVKSRCTHFNRSASAHIQWHLCDVLIVSQVEKQQIKRMFSMTSVRRRRRSLPVETSSKSDDDTDHKSGDGQRSRLHWTDSIHFSPIYLCSFKQGTAPDRSID